MSAGDIFVPILLSVFLCSGFTISSYIKYEKLPGVAFDFKIHVDAGEKECFYQWALDGTRLAVDYQVLRGGDGTAGFAITHPNGTQILPYVWKEKDSYQTDFADEGTYEICLDNKYSMFSSLLVSLLIVNYKAEQWDLHSKALEELDVSVTNFTEELKLVDERINRAMRDQRSGQLHEIKDYYMLEANLSYIHWWSLTQCVLIICTSFFQAYFLKKFFD